jgi:hypothetical protein
MAQCNQLLGRKYLDLTTTPLTGVANSSNARVIGVAAVCVEFRTALIEDV